VQSALTTREILIDARPVLFAEAFGNR